MKNCTIEPCKYPGVYLHTEKKPYSTLTILLPCVSRFCGTRTVLLPCVSGLCGTRMVLLPCVSGLCGIRTVLLHMKKSVYRVCKGFRIIQPIKKIRPPNHALLKKNYGFCTYPF